MIRILQLLVGAPPDGIYGPVTALRLQAARRIARRVGGVLFVAVPTVFVGNIDPPMAVYTWVMLMAVWWLWPQPGDRLSQ